MRFEAIMAVPGLVQDIRTPSGSSEPCSVIDSIIFWLTALASNSPIMVRYTTSRSSDFEEKTRSL